VARSVDELTLINQRLRAQLDSIAPDNLPPAAITSQQLAGFFTELLRAGEWLRLNPQRDARLEEAVQEYRSHIERLQSLLPTLQAHLLAEKAQLEAERAQLKAATAWAEAARKTT
jgi:hypothetical protein